MNNLSMSCVGQGKGWRDDWLLKPTQISQEKLPVEICNVGLSPVILSLQPYDTNNRLSSSLMGEMRSGDRRLVSQGWVRSFFRDRMLGYDCGSFILPISYLFGATVIISQLRL